MTNIEAAKLEDVGLILTMIKELAEWEGYIDQVDASEELLSESLFGKSAIAKTLIASIDNRPVGYLIYCPKFTTYTGRNEIYLQDVYLREEARGGGVGIALRSELANIAIASNATRIEWFVDESNTMALSFYEQLGANIIDAIKVVRLSGANLSSVARNKR